jgi:hypothetical protein
MKISFIAENDWANVLTEYSHCLNKHSEDIECKSICFRPHPFNYSIQHDYDLENCSDEILERARKWVDESDVIIFGEEGHPLENKYRTIREFDALLGLDLINSNKKLCIWHPGTHYRQNYQFYNNHPLRSKIHKHLYSIDLYRLSNKEENDLPIHAYQYVNFSYEKFISDFKSKLKIKPWTILHIPSNASVKGTEQINNIISKLNLDPSKFQYKTLEGVPHSQVIKEKEHSVFYIDQYNPLSVGGYGVSTLESLFASNLTFSTINNISDSMFKLTGQYECPVISLGTSQEELYFVLNNFILTSTENQLIEYMEGIGQWLETVYSPQSIVNYFNTI